jgi:tetratricopeptide (TPR) repeat protein
MTRRAITMTSEPSAAAVLRYRLGVLITSALMLTALPAPVFAGQDIIARVKDYYANASYEEALQTLRSAPPSGPTAGVTDAAAYQVFCLVALGREQEATDAIAAIVRVDPLYHPTETDVSPRIRTFFESVRKPLLPGIVRQLYAGAKDRLERKEAAEAKKDLDRVIALLDEMKASEDQDLADLKTLALGFRDLSVIAAAREAAPPPPPVVAPPVVQPAASLAPPKEPVIYSPSDTDVTMPVVVSRSLPPWRAVSAVERLQAFRGQLELVIDESGKVLSTKMLKGLRADYDPALMKAASAWTFRPATKDGKPVRYRYVMDMQLGGAQD